MRHLGLFAHPDDEVFCVAGTFAAAADRGDKTMVLSFTKGEAGQISNAALATRATLGQVRANELDAACSELGVTTNQCLDFADGQLATMPRDPLVERAVAAIRSFRPDCVYSFDHTGAYGHPDHIAISEVSLAACKAAGDPLAFPHAGASFAPRQLLHACFPQTEQLLLQMLVDWLTGLEDRFRGSDEFINALLMFADGTSMLGYASDHLRVEWFPRGSFIIEQGEPATSLYLVLSGEVDVIVEAADGGQSQVGSVGPGEFLGEIGIAAGSVRNAHCVAAANTACFVLSPAAPDRAAARGMASPAGSPIISAEPASVEPVAIDVEHDVSRHVARKVYALSRHATQYTITPGLFPDVMVHALLGTELFHRAWTHPTD